MRPQQATLPTSQINTRRQICRRETMTALQLHQQHEFDAVRDTDIAKICVCLQTWSADHSCPSLLPDPVPVAVTPFQRQFVKMQTQLLSEGKLRCQRRQQYQDINDKLGGL